MITKWRFAASVAAPAMLLASLSASQNADAATITFEGTIDQVVGSQNFSLGDTFTGVVDIDEIPMDTLDNPAIGGFGPFVLDGTVTFDNGITIGAAEATGVAFDNVAGNNSALRLQALDINQGSVAPTDPIIVFDFFGLNPASESFEDLVLSLNGFESFNGGFGITGDLTSLSLSLIHI